VTRLRRWARAYLDDVLDLAADLIAWFIN